MTRRLLLLAALAAALLTWGGQATAGIVPGYPYVPGEVLIKFKDSVTTLQKDALRGEMRSAQLREFRGIQVEQLSLQGLTVEEAIARFEGDPRVEYIEPNYVLKALTVPNDPMFGELWGMNNTGQTPTGGEVGTPDADIDAVEAWSVFTGSSDVLVCVIDTGINYNHPDLAANAWTNPGEIAGNGLDDDSNGFVDDIHGWDFVNADNDPMDDHGHGSHCSGTIGGVGNNAVGVAGVNWTVKIMGAKFLDASGFGDTADAIGCIEYAVMMGADVLSNSWGGGPFDQAMQDAIQAAYVADVFFVAAAGNSGSNNDSSPHYPSSYPNGNVIAVMATDGDDNRVVEPGWWSSSYGATSVDIAAPGLYIWSTVLGTAYDNYSGTSMATPHVSGALAMLRGRFPNITVDAGKSLLMTVGNDVLPQLSGLCVSGARLNLLKLIADPDTTPPSAVTDLATTTVASNWIDLQWTAPADDFDTMTGTCSAYDLRYSTSPIDDISWATATLVVGEPNPAAPGTPETFRVNGLAFSTPYYFALKSLDEYGNVSPLSNVPSATTLGAPTIAVSPPSLSATLSTGGSTSQTLTVSNVGQGVLDFTVGTEYIIPAKAAFAPVQQYEYVELAKGQADTRQPVAGVTGSGGPDAFGYTWRDSDEAGGPAYNWIEISGIGTPIAFTSDDQNVAGLPIGFSFPFYGADYTTFNACTNGWISFSSTSTTYSNVALPAAGAPANLIAPFWDDMTFSSTGDAFYYYDGTRLIIEYQAVPHLTTGGPYTMQVHLYPNGVIEFHYQSMVSVLDSATIGIQNATGTDGLTAAFNAAYVHDNLAIRFASVPPWLSTGPGSGSIAAGASVDLTVDFNATGLCGSHFDANLHLLSNDPVTPDQIVPVGLDLIGTPDLQASPPSLDFGSVYMTASSTLNVTVANGGCADLHVTGIAFDHADFTSTAVPFTVLASASAQVPVTFAPATAGPITGNLTLTSDDPDSPTVVIPLSGVGLEFPNIAVAPPTLSATLPTGGTDTQTLTISNSGAGVLNFTIPEPDYVLAKQARVVQHEYVEMAKGAQDSRTGGPVVLGSGGPDAFGYTWKDSDDPGGPAFNWIEIDALGTALTMGDDSNLGPFPLGFNFDYYGTSYSSFRVCSNGWISFTSTATAHTNAGLPAAAAPANMVALFWDDMNPSIGGTVYYYNDGTRMIVEWKNVPHYGSGGPYSMQVHLYPNGRIEYHYLSMTAPLDSGTIGIQNADGTDGLQVVFNAAYMHDNLAIRFQAQAPWLSIAPTAGAVNPGQSVDVQVTFNAADLCGDSYSANIHVLSNDPDSPDVTVPATLDLIGTPDAQVSSASLDFGSVYLTQSASLPLTLANAGCATLSVTGLAIDNGVFTVDLAAPFTVPVGGGQLLNLTFTPVAAGPAAGNLTITTDDPVEPTIVVPLAGVGLNNAVVAVTPTSMTQNVPYNGLRTQPLTITNNGDGPLTWSIPAADIFTKQAPPDPENLYRELPKDGTDPRTGGAVVLGAGGPDAWGYRWKDSDEPGGPVYNWVEISTTGTVAMSTGDDANAGPFPIGFTLKYYDDQFDTFRVCSNGWMSFSSTATAYSNSALPSTGAPLNMLAPFWDDLNVTGGAAIYYQNVGENLVVQWNAVPHYGTPAGGPYTFQVIVSPNGKIVFQYKTLGTTRLNECTVGIQNGTGTIGLQSAFNATYLHDNMAIQYLALPEWLSVAPTSGTIPAHSNVEVTATFDATDLDYGTHTAQLLVMSNDIVTPQVTVPVTMEVIDVTAVDDTAPRPLVQSLAQNSPNPFNPQTSIEFGLPARAQAELRIYDARGALVRTLVSAELPAGVHRYTWDGRNDRGVQAASGTYFYRLRAAGKELVRRMTLVK